MTPIETITALEYMKEVVDVHTGKSVFKFGDLNWRARRDTCQTPLLL